MNDTDVTRPQPSAPPIAELVRPRVTVTQLAEAAGVSIGHMARVLRGERQASRRVRAAAVQLLGMSEEELFGAEEVDRS